MNQDYLIPRSDSAPTFSHVLAYIANLTQTTVGSINISVYTVALSKLQVLR